MRVSYGKEIEYCWGDAGDIASNARLLYRLPGIMVVAKKLKTERKATILYCEYVSTGVSHGACPAGSGIARRLSWCALVSLRPINR
jgi:hypothetical protein